MTGPYRHHGGAILHATGRIIEPQEARMIVLDWAERAEIAHRFGLTAIARAYAAWAISLGEAYVAARDWRAAA